MANTLLILNFYFPSWSLYVMCIVSYHEICELLRKCPHPASKRPRLSLPNGCRGRDVVAQSKDVLARGDNVSTHYVYALPLTVSALDHPW